MILIAGIILMVSVMFSKALYRFGVPTLLIFLGLGMALGSDGLNLISVDFGDAQLVQDICTVGLIFIMFYGGFGANWKAARPIAMQAILLSSLGTFITAGLVGLFCHFSLKMPWLEGMLLGAVVSSTDAASVFSILRSKKLHLKGGLASLLEVESGSNDPFAYMLTIVLLSFINQSAVSKGIWSVVYVLGAQLLFGLAIGAGMSAFTSYILRRIRFEIDGLYPIFLIASALMTYVGSALIGGNGFLAVYILGLVVGNSRIQHKKSLVHFFDGMTWLLQIALFFVLGLLVFPSQLPAVSLPGLAIAVFMLLIARPLATASILFWFKTPLRQQALVAWAGLRGAASIVFATLALSAQIPEAAQIFNIVFFIALFSVIVQGSALPWVAKKLSLVDESGSVFKTFNDYEYEIGGKVMEYQIAPGSQWAGKAIMDADIPEEVLVLMIKRDGRVIVPKGATVIEPGDTLVLSSSDFDKLVLRAGNEASAGA